MKAKNWRKYYGGYRPPSLTYTASASEISEHERAYIEWLAETRGLTFNAAEGYARNQQRGEVIAATVDIESNACAVEWISNDCAIRTVKVWTGGQHYGYLPVPAWAPDREPEQGWQRLHKPDAPTTYRVILGGRCVNEFLTKALAKRWAREMIDSGLNRPIMGISQDVGRSLAA